jgi:hypothetical protein
MKFLSASFIPALLGFDAFDSSGEGPSDGSQLDGGQLNFDL